MFELNTIAESASHFTHDAGMRRTGKLNPHTMNQHARPEFWDTNETASAIGITTKTLREFVRKGLIPCIKLSAGCHRYNPAQVREAMSKLATGV